MFVNYGIHNEREIKIQAFYLVDYKTVHYANIRDSPERSQENILWINKHWSHKW